MEDALLEGRMCIAKELINFQSPERKYQIGCKPGGADLIRVSGLLNTSNKQIVFDGDIIRIS